ncbi:MAG: hypothetical protein AAGF20_00760, partial [Pseudomonadota bacterium]
RAVIDSPLVTDIFCPVQHDQIRGVDAGVVTLANLKSKTPETGADSVFRSSAGSGHVIRTDLVTGVPLVTESGSTPWSMDLVKREPDGTITTDPYYDETVTASTGFSICQIMHFNTDALGRSFTVGDDTRQIKFGTRGSGNSEFYISFGQIGSDNSDSNNSTSDWYLIPFDAAFPFTGVVTISLSPQDNEACVMINTTNPNHSTNAVLIQNIPSNYWPTKFQKVRRFADLNDGGYADLQGFGHGIGSSNTALHTATGAALRNFIVPKLAAAAGVTLVT